MDIFERLKNLTSSKDSPSGPVEWILAGLGNPGPKYENTRHNAGFITIDALAAQHRLSLKKLKFQALTENAFIDGKHCLLMKPVTYMNNSGKAIAEAMKFYKIPIQRVLIVYDDISLQPGQLRMRRKGSDGGHNGIKSILLHCGDTFPRIKLGVGGKPHPEYDLADWVLSAFSKEETAALHSAIEKALDAIPLIVNEKMDKAMNLYNS